MNLTISKTSSLPDDKSLLLLVNDKNEIKSFDILQNNELEFVLNDLEGDKKTSIINQYNRWIMIQLIEEDPNANLNDVLEGCRKSGYTWQNTFNQYKIQQLCVAARSAPVEQIVALVEGMALASYQFRKYILNGKDALTFKKLQVYHPLVRKIDLEKIQVLAQAVHIARDLVNEPLSGLNALQLAEAITKMGNDAGFKVEVYNKKKIESLKMGGLLAVNRGSTVEPTFSVLQYKPSKPVNDRPIVLVGKGIVFDTGGLSIKPTPNSMDLMKSDMAGAAVVSSIIYAVAKLKIPVHLIGLIPATDNKVASDAYVPGDVITMYDGKTVEVLNTDAEGRLILADALSYAKKYDPLLVADFATLTGSAAAAVGHYGIVFMGTANEQVKNQLRKCGDETYERLVEFPLWNEYDELLKSDIADMKNIGGAVAGAITAGKFLQRFVEFPWLHFDIAGPSFIKAQDSYRGKNATGIGVRLIVHFLEEMVKNKELVEL